MEILDERSKEVNDSQVSGVLIDRRFFASGYKNCCRLHVSAVLASGRRLGDRSCDRSRQRDSVSGPEGHLSARPEETFHFGRALSPVVIHRRGTVNSIPPNFMLDRQHRSPSAPCQAASREVERDFNSVYSRLVLCKTFRYTHTHLIW